MNILDNIKIIIVEPSGAGNIGAVARAMKNFGFKDLCLVNPSGFDMGKCLDTARWAEKIIENRSVMPTFEMAIADCYFVLGVTRRTKKNEGSLGPKEASRLIIDQAKNDKIALVFGREKNGLLKKEKEQCSLFSSIKTQPGAGGSLNLSHAFAIFAYEIFSAFMEKIYLEK